MNAAEIRSFMNSLACKPEDKATYEVALQLAELNDKLTPARILTAIAEIQGELDKRDKGAKP